MRNGDDKSEIFVGDYDEWLERLSTNGSGWTRELRRQARARYGELGVPTTRDEAWRFTSLASLTARDYAPADRADELSTSASAVLEGPGRIEGLGPHRAVLVDGFFRPELSSLEGLPEGLIVVSWGEALGSHRALLEPHLERDAAGQSSAFEALNAAWAQDGLLVHLAADVRLESPLHLVLLTCEGEEARMAHPRVVVRAERGSELTLVEDHLSSGDTHNFVNLVVDVEVGANAGVQHVKLARVADRESHIASLRVRQDRDSRFASHSMCLDGALVRNDVRVRLEGANAHSVLNGLVVARGGQLVDNHTEVHHLVSHTSSSEHYRSVLDDDAQGVFSGRVFVAQDAQKTDAEQSNANLLLSDRARMNTMPQLEIYADDIKASHGATLGQLDEDALFYLRTRGIGEEVARAMLVYAFANAVVEEVPVEAVRALVRRRVFEHLPHDHLSEEMV